MGKIAYDVCVKLRMETFHHYMLVGIMCTAHGDCVSSLVSVTLALRTEQVSESN